VYQINQRNFPRVAQIDVCEKKASCQNRYGFALWDWAQIQPEKQRKQIQMDLIVLVCVVSAALALGVLAAYVICTVMFAAFRMHAEQVAVKKPVGSAISAGAARVAQS
jgi:hypothetical protein